MNFFLKRLNQAVYKVKNWNNVTKQKSSILGEKEWLDKTGNSVNIFFKLNSFKQSCEAVKG